MQEQREPSSLEQTTKSKMESKAIETRRIRKSGRLRVRGVGGRDRRAGRTQRMRGKSPSRKLEKLASKE